MKKILALTLAALMLVAMLTACGETKPAETVTTEITPIETTPIAGTEQTAEPEVVLRDGEAVEVTTEEEFFAAYAQIYAADSTVNCIRLSDNVNALGKLELLPADVDPITIPHLTENGYIVVRMPEGTALDLNGYALTLRGIQGMDNETGAASELTTLGQVIDTFPQKGGVITLRAWKDNDHMVHALDVTNQYPGIVTTLQITQDIRDAADYDYVIPENVLLMISFGQELTAKSITFKPGATCINAKEGSGIIKTPTIIFECRGEADHSRPGIEFATEVIDVE